MNKNIERLMNDALNEFPVSFDHSHMEFVEHFAKLIVKECTATNVKTATTMRDNGLPDHCSPHQYNFEINEWFGTTVVKHVEDDI